MLILLLNLSKDIVYFIIYLFISCFFWKGVKVGSDRISLKNNYFYQCLCRVLFFNRTLVNLQPVLLVDCKVFIFWGRIFLAVQPETWLSYQNMWSSSKTTVLNNNRHAAVKHKLFQDSLKKYCCKHFLNFPLEYMDLKCALTVAGLYPIYFVLVATWDLNYRDRSHSQSNLRSTISPRWFLKLPGWYVHNVGDYFTYMWNITTSSVQSSSC